MREVDNAFLEHLSTELEPNTARAPASCMAFDRADQAGVDVALARIDQGLSDYLVHSEIDLTGPVCARVGAAVDAFQRGKLESSSGGPAQEERE